MTEWYYASADGRRHGPLPAAELLVLAAAGTIDARTLVWREGKAQWRPLQDFAVELGLPALPPPLPTPAPATPPAAHPRPRNLSGCAIAALVAVAGVFVIAMLGVLAAIALPAYQDYTLRAQAGAAIAGLLPLQEQVAGFSAAQGRCPGNGDEPFGAPEDHAQPGIASVAFGQFEESGLCGLEARISAPGKELLDGKAIWLEYQPSNSTWHCSSEVADKLLPVSCRG